MEILRFYLRATWYGRGLAQPLMDAALVHARAGGHDGVWLQVWEHNARARRFYEKSGFVAVGTNPFLFGNTPEEDIVYQILFGSSDGSPG
jgi:ribosomal protein S18 acetylase RimI-like enzyme